MRLAAIVLFLSVSAVAQKMPVKVLRHSVDGKSVTRFIPGLGLANGTATAYGNTATASGSSVYLPAHTQELTLNRIEMLLLLPDGRRAGVYCNDHGIGLTKERIHSCKNPEVDELEADFSGDKVKLTWGVGLDGKKKESETYIVGPVYPATTVDSRP
jgi:hypothetical protein